MTALEELAKVAGTLTNPYIDRWKEKGGKVIGTYCNYVPEEVIHAAGILPYRMRATGSTNTELGDLYTDHMNCSFIRHLFDQAMRGEFKFLDGLACVFSCDHSRRNFDVWRYGKVEYAQPDTFYYRMISVPFKDGDITQAWMADEMDRFRKSLEEHFKVTITDDDLKQSIKLYNEKRRLLMKLYELRKSDLPPVTGAEVLKIVVASQSMPVEEFNPLLNKAIDEVKDRKAVPNYRARLILAGGELDNADYIEVIEELGGLVVTDFLCFGTRYFWEMIDEDDEPMRAISRRYLLRISCPRNTGQDERFKWVSDMAKEYKADGIVIQKLKFCDNWGCECVMWEWDAKKADLPLMVLEREYLLGSVGQLQTRTQAFLERVESR